MTHTPGPWHSDWSKDGCRVLAQDASLVANVFVKDNAAMISAAPELYEALDELLRWHHSKDDRDPIAVRARDAIAKAEGK